MPGRIIDGYELIDQLRGEPDRASFKARDTHTGQVVALHLLRQASQHASPRDLTAFARLMHPNLLAIWDAGTFDEEGRLTPFVVTPVLDGVTLEDIIRQARAPLTTERIGDFALQACAGLEALHEQNLVHGHLTPGKHLQCPHVRRVIRRRAANRPIMKTTLFAASGRLVISKIC